MVTSPKHRGVAPAEYLGHGGSSLWPKASPTRMKSKASSQTLIVEVVMAITIN
jgi:hypothetical protein